MFESDADIANAALSKCKVSAFIEDLENDDSTEGKWARFWYPKLRDLLLKSHDWNFARERAALNLLAGVTRTNWAHAYQLPADFLALRGIVIEGQRVPLPKDRVPHELLKGAAGTILCTDAEAVEVAYTARVEDIGRFPIDFTLALASALGAELLAPLKGPDSIAKRGLLLEAKGFADQAVAADMNQGHDVEPECEALKARR